jgi:rhodanese-related sulfurtransferase
MSGVLSRMTTNQKLAVVAFVLGAVALFAKPQAGHAVSISPKDLAVIVEKQVDHVTPAELARWLIEGRSDVRIVDLRDETQYAEYHIPGAELVPLPALPDQSFAPTEKVVLYSEGGIHSAQGWFLLKARGASNAYFLLGGLDAWKSEVLFPTLAANPTPDQQRANDGLKSVAAHFGGRAMVATTSGEAGVAAAAPALPAMPKVEAPAAPVGGRPSSGPKKRKEGC